MLKCVSSELRLLLKPELVRYHKYAMCDKDGEREREETVRKLDCSQLLLIIPANQIFSHLLMGLRPANGSTQLRRSTQSFYQHHPLPPECAIRPCRSPQREGQGRTEVNAEH